MKENPEIVECEITESGRTVGFEIAWDDDDDDDECREVGRYGDFLEAGQPVMLNDGRLGFIFEIYRTIQTQQGRDNYVTVEIDIWS